MDLTPSACWVREGSSREFRGAGGAGLADGELPGFSFSPTLGVDPSQPVLIQGPLPGTSFGATTLVQPTTGEGDLNGLITVAGDARALDAATQGFIRAVGSEMGASLLRLQALDDQRQQAEAMEQANRLAGLATPYAADQRAALGAIRPVIAELLRSESLHLAWVYGGRLHLVAGHDAPLHGDAPNWQ